MLGCPTVSLATDPQMQQSSEVYGSTYVTKVVYHQCVEFKATIRSYPTHCDVKWKKGSNTLNLNDTKYKGSSAEFSNPVLRINMVTKEDNDIYRIEAQNIHGEGTSQSIALEVIAGEKRSLKIPWILVKVTKDHHRPYQSLKYMMKMYSNLFAKKHIAPN